MKFHIIDVLKVPVCERVCELSQRILGESNSDAEVCSELDGIRLENEGEEVY